MNYFVSLFLAAIGGALMGPMMANRDTPFWVITGICIGVAFSATIQHFDPSKDVRVFATIPIVVCVLVITTLTRKPRLTSIDIRKAIFGALWMAITEDLVDSMDLPKLAGIFAMGFGVEYMAGECLPSFSAFIGVGAIYFAIKVAALLSLA
ncbi:Aste57867_10846 [Aphanomyces stellatus]|uniref:Aste57867_10846 protein n=1 Tax=Aphanomyces stellatus TaxID=120398 RepID=A0A485KRY4_9STRA|nr:hypothetical protein As57867_010806 [Aphanomyces stellatus]VFT87714.1 Aste57867_10846 [Aphanomyces stellatus]